MPVQLQPVIFERFKPAGLEASIGQSDTGLGLAICKALVVLHGGESGLESGESVESNLVSIAGRRCSVRPAGLFSLNMDLPAVAGFKRF